MLGASRRAAGGKFESTPMLAYTIHRIFIMVPTLLAISAIVFTIIQLPPGDYFEAYINELLSRGESVDLQKIEQLRQLYGVDRPIWQQYIYWVWGLVQGE